MVEANNVSKHKLYLIFPLQIQSIWGSSSPARDDDDDDDDDGDGDGDGGGDGDGDGGCDDD